MNILNQLDKYELQVKLGSGGFGTVWRARDTVLDRIVALKIILADISKKDIVLREARLLANLNHVHIVVVHNAGYDEPSKNVFIEMEYLEQTLEQILGQDKRLDFDRASGFILPVLEALEYAHRKVIHRDIKAANILVSIDGTVKLGDFGIAQEYADGGYLSSAGVFSHMAPENFSAKPKCDHRSDLWSVGHVLYQLLTGHEPFSLPPDSGVFGWPHVYATQKAAPLSKYLRDFPDGLQEILDCALAVGKSERYASARDFADALGKITLSNISTQKDEFISLIPPKSITIPSVMPSVSKTTANTAASENSSVQRDTNDIEGLTVEIIQNNWPYILKTFQRESPVGIRFLERSEPIRLQGKQIVLAFKDTKSRDIIASNRNGRALVEKIIDSALNTKGCEIRCTLATNHLSFLEEVFRCIRR